MADEIVSNYTKISEILNFHYIYKIHNKNINGNTEFCEEIQDYEYNGQSPNYRLAQFSQKV